MKRMIAIVVFVGGLWQPLSAQLDFLAYQAELRITCGFVDSVEVLRQQSILDSLTTVNIGAGKKEFLYAYGWTYYSRYLKWKDLRDLEISARAFEQGWAEFRDISALWNLGGMYSRLGNCNRSIELTELYLSELPDTAAVKYDQVYYRYKFCWGQLNE